MKHTKYTKNLLQIVASFLLACSLVSTAQAVQTDLPTACLHRIGGAPASQQCRLYETEHERIDTIADGSRCVTLCLDCGEILNVDTHYVPCYDTESTVCYRCWEEVKAPEVRHVLNEWLEADEAGTLQHRASCKYGDFAAVFHEGEEAIVPGDARCHRSTCSTCGTVLEEKPHTVSCRSELLTGSAAFSYSGTCLLCGEDSVIATSREHVDSALYAFERNDAETHFVVCAFCGEPAYPAGHVRSTGGNVCVLCGEKNAGGNIVPVLRLPASTERIEAGAFRGLRRAVFFLPASVSAIAEDAFVAGCTLIFEQNTIACEFAEAHAGDLFVALNKSTTVTS